MLVFFSKIFPFLQDKVKMQHSESTRGWVEISSYSNDLFNIVLAKPKSSLITKNPLCCRRVQQHHADRPLLPEEHPRHPQDGG